MQFATTINGQGRVVTCDPGATLVELLRQGGFHSVKQGCDHEGTCGACTVLLDGVPILACITPAPRIAGRSVTTVEGLGTVGAPHPIQEAFADSGAVQCGFCTPGMVLATKALLERQASPSKEQIDEALSGNLCRCTGYVKIIDAVRLSAERMANPEKAEPSSQETP